MIQNAKIYVYVPIKEEERIRQEERIKSEEIAKARSITE